MEKSLSALVISPAPGTHGGVATFCETMKKNLTHYKVTSLYVGTPAARRCEASISRSNPVFANVEFSGLPRLLRRLAMTMEKLCQAVKHSMKMLIHLITLTHNNRFDVIHINPSLNAKSLLRDGLILLVLQLTGHTKILVYFHGWDNQVESRIKHNLLLRLIFTSLLNTAKRIMVLAPEFRQALMDMGVKSDSIIYATTMFDGDSLQCGYQGT